MLEHFHQPHYRQRFEGEAARHAFGLHAGAADTTKLDAGVARFELTYQPSAKNIAGKLPGHEVNTLQGHKWYSMG